MIESHYLFQSGLFHRLDLATGCRPGFHKLAKEVASFRTVHDPAVLSSRAESANSAKTRNVGYARRIRKRRIFQRVNCEMHRGGPNCDVVLVTTVHGAGNC